MASTQPIPQHFMLALYPGFQLLDVAGPLDILNMLSLINPLTSKLTLTIIASTLDPVPVKAIPPIDPQTNQPKWTFPNFPTINDKTNTSFSQSICPTVTFDSYLAAIKDGKVSSSVDGDDDNDNDNVYKPIDVLFIPGGIGTRILRTTTSTGTTESNVADLLRFIPQIAPRVRHSILTVCTGSDVLGQTGLLNGRRATTNMMRFNDVAAKSPGVKWLKGRRWVRSLPSEVVESSSVGKDGNGPYKGEIWTSAGISAGIDVTFAFVNQWYGGVEVARDIAKKLEYEWREIGEGMVDPMYGLSEEETK